MYIKFLNYTQTDKNFWGKMYEKSHIFRIFVKKKFQYESMWLRRAQRYNFLCNL